MDRVFSKYQVGGWWLHCLAGLPDLGLSCSRCCGGGVPAPGTWRCLCCCPLGSARAPSMPSHAGLHSRFLPAACVCAATWAQEYRQGKDMVILEGATVSTHSTHSGHSMPSTACPACMLHAFSLTDLRQCAAGSRRPPPTAAGCILPYPSPAAFHRCDLGSLQCMEPLPNRSIPCPAPPQVDGIGNLVELNGRFAAELDAPVLMVRCARCARCARLGRGLHSMGALGQPRRAPPALHPHALNRLPHTLPPVAPTAPLLPPLPTTHQPTTLHHFRSWTCTATRR